MPIASLVMGKRNEKISSLILCIRQNKKSIDKILKEINHAEFWLMLVVVLQK